MRPAALALLLAAAPVTGGADAPPPELPAGAEVAAVELRLPPGEDEGEARGLVGIAPGDRLDRRAVRGAVERLFATGRCGNVVASARPAAGAPERVVLTLACQPRRVVEALRVVNPAPWPALDEGAVRRSAALVPGDELWRGRLEDAAARVRAAYARRGYRATRVEATATGEPLATVELRIEDGPPTRVAELVLSPVPGVAPERLVGGLATRQGAVLDLDALDEDVRTLRGRLRREGFLRSRLTAPLVQVEGTRARVELPFDAGPRFEFRFVGAAAFTGAELRDQLGIEAEQSLDAPAIETAAGRLRAFYLSRGYALARAAAEEWALPGAVAVVFRIEEGRRYRVREVSFPGATERSPEWLRARLDDALLALAPPASSGEDADAERVARAAGSTADARSRAVPDPRHVWNPPLWEQAARRVAELYRAEGFLEAAFEGDRAVLDARAGTADVTLRLREGPCTRVATVRVEGNREVTEADLAPALRLAAGDPLAYAAVEATRTALLAEYARRGFPYARVTEVEELSADRTAAQLWFRVDEGPRVRYGKVIVTGARRTRDEVVRAALAVRTGDTYDPEALARSQAALLRLGVFRSVGLRLRDPDVPDATKDVTVEVAERPWQTMAAGFGFSIANGPRATVELVQPNVFGEALEFSTRGKVNYPLTVFRPDLEGRPPWDRVEGRVDAGLRDAHLRLLGIDYGARVGVFAERVHRPAYDLSRASTVLGTDVAAASRLTLSLQYELEVDQIDKSPAAQAGGLTLTQADVERLRFPEGLTFLHTLRAMLALDHRDSSVHPRRGWLVSGTAEYAHSIGTSADSYLFGLVPGSDVYVNMVRLMLMLSGYLPVGEQSVLAVSLRGGRVLPLDPASQTIGTKRYFVGGATTDRGYPEDTMLPQDVRNAYLAQIRACASSLSGAACSSAARQVAAGQSIVSEGGEAFGLAKIELRFPVVASFEAGLFADVGNLWLDPRNVSLSNLHTSFGLGLRFLTPIGPAVLDIGFNPTADARLNEMVVVPHFSIGLF